MTDIIRSIRAELILGEKVIDCYELPDGEKRIGLAGASIAIGQNSDYLSRSSKASTKQFKSLLGTGYTDRVLEVDIKLDRGATRSKTISVRDFTKLITWDAIVNKNTSSIILLASFAEVGLEDTLDRLFKKQSLDHLSSKIVHYTKWTTEDWVQALKANEEDWKTIAEQEYFNKTGQRLFI